MFQTPIKSKARSCWLLLWGIGLLVVLVNIGSTSAQSPDRSGWDAPNNQLQFDEATYQQPNSSQTDSSQPNSRQIDLLEPDAFVRNQIGLASFEEPALDSQTAAQEDAPNSTTLFSPEQLTSPEGLGSSLQAILLIATLSLAPAIILMTTCYVRVIVVLTLLKQAFGAQQLPPTQVLTALSLFITLLVMTPVWNQIKRDAVDPYTQAENGITWNEAWERGIVPVKTFMAKQIEAAGNDQSIALFYEYLPPESTGQLVSQGAPDQSNDTPIDAQAIPINVLLPAFVISELKVAFLLGFQIYLPFLVLDLVVSSVTVSTGMLMLPPTMVSFPLKLIMFVLVDGWNLVVGMLLQSFSTFG